VAQKTNTAAAEGQSDLHAAKDASASYLEQAKTVADNVVTSAQVGLDVWLTWFLQIEHRYFQDYLRGSTDPQAAANQQGSSTGPVTTTSVISSLQTSASSAVGTAQQYLSSAQVVAQPHIDQARSTLQPHVEKVASMARETAEGYLGTHSGTSHTDAVTPPLPADGRSSTITNYDAPLSGEDVQATLSTTTTAGADQQNLGSNVA